MTDYVKSTNFASKDSLAIGNPLKIVKGTEIDAEFNNIATAVATKADLANPTFTGVPAAPTASVGTNTTQVATTAFVIAERTATSTLTNKSLTSPTLTGTPVAPTAAVNTNTTQLATTAFVVAQIADDAPTKTGTGASGSWGISVTGSAATVTTVTTAQVATATAGVSAGAVGTYMFGYYNGATTPIDFGVTVSGADLKPSNSTGNNVGSSQTGTWRCMGYAVSGSTSQNQTTLWLRIS